MREQKSNKTTGPSGDLEMEDVGSKAQVCVRNDKKETELASKCGSD